MRYPNTLRRTLVFHSWRWLIVPALLALFCSNGSATGLKPPSGKVVLTVSGAIAEGTADKSVQFDFAGLEALGIEHVETANPWLSDITRFSGVPLATVLKAVGAYGKTVRAKALNDYRADIPVTDLEKYRILVALRRNGEPMTVRDKGPLWIIYPIEGDPTDAPLEIRNRMVWQLNALEVLD